VTEIQPLSPDQQYQLETYEAIIAEGLKTFVKVGVALMQIRERRLYRGQYSTFEAYCQERWGMKRSYAHRTIEAAKIVTEDLLPIGNIPDEPPAETLPLPANEAQVRPLTALPPEVRREAWQQAVETAPSGRVTATHVQQAFPKNWRNFGR
jgi:hypothetical protein